MSNVEEKIKDDFKEVKKQKKNDKKHKKLLIFLPLSLPGSGKSTIIKALQKKNGIKLDKLNLRGVKGRRK